MPQELSKNAPLGGREEHPFIGHMPDVQGYDRSLRSLGQWWQKITLIGKINSLNIAATLLDDMEYTKRKFEQLQVQLIDNLVAENLRKVEQEIGARAQVAIDILIRNLFERTADVGFLATDDDLRAFLAAGGDDPDARAAIRKRLHEYTLKYSVYDEILVLDPQGRVRANLDPDNPVMLSRDPLIAETLATTAEYVETFRHSDLRPAVDQSLIYSCAIRAGNSPGAPILGVLCLCFRFADEMAGIFANIASEQRLVSILDRDRRVIASSNPERLPLGTKVQGITAGAGEVRHGDRDCLACTRTTQGYQGFRGLGWMGHVLVPLSDAFGARGDDNGRPETGGLDHSGLFSEELREISRTAAMVTDDLILVVLNGQIISAKKDAAEFMPVLEEIRTICNRTKAVFDNSIANLHDTVLSALLDEVRFQAFLAVDIMDRNLYERANDVRWWALTSRFRELLAQGVTPGDAGAAAIAAILAYINGLYTVYTNLVVYDRAGTVVAVSNVAEQHQVGRSLADDATVQAALKITHSQRYTVSPFRPTPLYGDRPSYVYHTSIRAPAPGESVVGGIGIVFDSEPQFAAMLRDALPRDGQGAPVEGAFALFTDRNGRVIAATGGAYGPGDTVALEPRFATLEQGARDSALVEFGGRRYAAGAAMSQGYREYKTTGDYANDILGLVFVPV